MHNRQAIDDLPSVTRDEIPPHPSILIVDDSKSVAMLLGKILETRSYECTLAYNSAEARERLSEKEFDLVLSDMNMPPGESGMELIRFITKTHLDTATILITAEDDPELGQTAINIGAFGFIIKPFNNNELIINVSNALARSRLTRINRNSQKRLEQMVLKRTNELLDTITRLERAEKSLRHSQEETINRLAKAAEFRDNETANHIMRMSRYCELLAMKLGLGEERCDLIRTASPMHDIGKIGITDEILLKPGKLTESEFEIMKHHADIGFRILTGSTSELLNMGAIIARTHHEQYDGSGYPEGLVGEDIPLEGRITAIGDVFDALTSKRVYKPAFSLEKVLEMMKAKCGSHFDPELCQLFLASMDEVLEIKNRYTGD